ncbi:hypothetical protein [Streptomyces sp. NPDC087300]|uniref:hypothetical protein n=1 Tax=Streptomyces sp. NPDC087300 TaxID=3365780 RepID=UPI00382FB838
MAVHFHAYTWVGSGAEYGRDAQRRPYNPGPNPDPAVRPEFDFRQVPVAPLEPAHWLLKDKKFVRDTFHEPGPALAWFEKEFAQHVDRLDGEHVRDPGTLRGFLDYARENMAAGQDIIGGWWGVKGSRFHAVHLIACPNRMRPEHPCPTGGR